VSPFQPDYSAVPYSPFASAETVMNYNYYNYDIDAQIREAHRQFEEQQREAQRQYEEQQKRM
jgi:hypothetical protein